jgi:hypothetical protein
MSVEEELLQGKKHYCSTPQAIGRGGVGLCAWPRNHVVTWNVVAPLPGFTVQSLQEIYKASFDLWTAVSGFKHAFTQNPRNANIIVGARDIDRAGGILGEHQLPCGNITATSQIQGWLDSSDSWTTAKNWRQTGRFPVHSVSAHEFGHGIGLSHAPENLQALMAPRLSLITTPQAWDKQEVVLRYGQDQDQDQDQDSDAGDLLGQILRCLERLSDSDKQTIKELFLE